MLEDKYIWSLVLSFLDHKSMCVAQRVCRLWCESTIEHMLWKTIYLSEFNIAHVNVKIVVTTENDPAQNNIRRKRKIEEKFVKREKKHKSLDAIKDINYKVLYQKRLEQGRIYIPYLDHGIYRVPELDDVFQNKGNRKAFWGMYQCTQSVCLPDHFGFSDWLSLLGLNGNYFEAWVTDGSVGLTNDQARLHSHIGWDSGTIGYHSDDGSVHATGAIQNLEALAPGFNGNDIVGCGFFCPSSDKQIVFFTHNGDVIYEAEHKYECEKLFPSVCLQASQDRAYFNLGKRPFVFDVVDFMLNKKNTTA